MTNNNNINGLFFHDDILIKQKEDLIPLVRYKGDIAVRLMSRFTFAISKDLNTSNIFIVKVEPQHILPSITDPLLHVTKIFDSIEKQGYDNKKDTLILFVVSESHTAWNYQMYTYIDSLRPQYSKDNIYFGSEQLNNTESFLPLLKKLSFFNQSIEVEKDQLVDSYMNHDIVKDKLFLSFNRRPVYHRTQLVLKLINDNLLDRGLVSFFIRIDDSNAADMIDSMNVTEEEKLLYKKQLEHNLILDNSNTGVGRASSEVIEDYYKRTYFSIVTESRSHDPELSFTEKTFKPIVHKHPFIILGVPGLVKWLKRMGFKTFHPLINESYDEINDYELRFKAVLTEVNRLSNLSQFELEDFWNKTKEITEYNFNYLNSDEFFNHVDYCTELFPFIEKFKLELGN